jgi:TolB protein
VVGQKGYYFAPDWSPVNSEIVFSGHWNSRGTYQIMIADARRAQGQIRQLTTQGDNEDPSWAPDGRHIVFSSGVGDQQLSLYVIDAVTETRRKLVDGGKLRMADWSPPLARASDYVVR